MTGNRSLAAGLGAGTVGTRAPSSKGMTMAAACAREWAGLHRAVVSGAAAGIDSAAHAAALEAGGATVAVLPQGLLTYALPKGWTQALEAGRLLLLSEFSPDLPWRTHAAVTRNATIAALSQVLCVIEPNKEGGSIATARHAISQGKPVLHFCRPGRVPPALQAPRALPLAGPSGLLSQFEAALSRPLSLRPRQEDLWPS